MSKTQAIGYRPDHRRGADARRLFARNGWPVIDVTCRSIEETAAAIQFYTGWQVAVSCDPFAILPSARLSWPRPARPPRTSGRAGLMSSREHRRTCHPGRRRCRGYAGWRDSCDPRRNERSVVCRSHELVPGQLLLADQILELDGDMLGKPASLDEAADGYKTGRARTPAADGSRHVSGRRTDRHHLATNSLHVGL